MNSSMIESVTSIALLRESSTMPGEYCVLASKRVTGEWHLHGGTVESGESASDAARRESMEEHGVTVLKLEYVGTYYYPTRKVSLYVSFPAVQICTIGCVLRTRHYRNRNDRPCADGARLGGPCKTCKSAS